MIVTYEVAGETRTLCAEGFSMEETLTLIPSHGHLTGVQYD